MTDQAPLQAVALTLRDDLQLEVQIGDKAVTVQLTAQAALELAQRLLTCGLEYARLRVEKRIEAEAIADQALKRAAH